MVNSYKSYSGLVKKSNHRLIKGMIRIVILGVYYATPIAIIWFYIILR